MSAQALASSQQYRFAFDIGGTFTDLVLLKGPDGCARCCDADSVGLTGLA